MTAMHIVVSPSLTTDTSPEVLSCSVVRRDRSQIAFVDNKSYLRFLKYKKRDLSGNLIS